MIKSRLTVSPSGQSTPLNNGGLVLLRKENRARQLHVLPHGNSAYAVMVNGRHLIAQVEKSN